ncbi:MAG: hypothetical protein JNK82_02135 [Myxococcaceae bacterium]|nr:hypothetical protein [Myxococcaceae bacterium]
MAGNVLLARPHPFIVEQMAEVLAAAGFTAHRLEGRDGQRRDGFGPLCGAIISAAVSAESSLTLIEAWRYLQVHHPLVPVAVSALADLSVIGPKLTRELSLASNVEIVGVERDLASHPARSTGRLVLFLTDRDIAERRARVEAALRAHFVVAGARER